MPSCSAATAGGVRSTRRASPPRSAALGSPDDWLAAMQEEIQALAAPRQDNFSAIAVWVRDPIESTRPMLTIV